jgi:hypothetical protein
MRRSEELEAILRSTPWMMEALMAARQVDAPDWLIGAGAVRTAVWDSLHGFDEPTALADLDLVFFDPADLSERRERALEDALRGELPSAPWDATNQAALHIWFEKRFGHAVKPVHSTEEAVATWPEVATCVGVRLARDDRLEVVAPHGLDDLLGLVHRRNPARVSIGEYERRLRTKRIRERWPLVRVL